MGNFGPTELLLILGIVVVFFGAKKIPELARGLGKGIREFKNATRELEETSTELARTADDAVGIKDLKDTVQGFKKTIGKSTTT